MPTEITMPKLSDTMEEGKILKWMKQVGERVAIGEVLAEVETDKANMELEAYDEGVLAEVKVPEGQSAPVGAVIAVLDSAGAATRPVPTSKTPPAAVKPAPVPPKSQAAPARPVAAKPAAAAVAERRPAVVRPSEPEPAERVKVSPLARKIAEEHRIDLSKITGTGPGGRIVEKDVEAVRAGGDVGRAKAPPPLAPAPAVSASSTPTAERVELSRIRRTTAKRMGEAKREVPHFYASTEIAMDEAVRLKEALTALEGEYAGLTFTHLLLKAVGLGLTRVPEVNSTYDGDAMVLHPAANIGLATAVPEGLLVPVVRNCDRESLAGIVRQTRGLVERAQAGRPGPEDLSGGTFTLSNLGMFGVSEFAAIINPPQAAILAVGAIRDVPVVREGRVVPGRVMTATLSCDHRVIDGVLAGRFLRELRTLVENPLALVV
jgi:pyruvate dehydrogenase E2 component (dihydrolipoamide acetyltransferase)